MYTTIGRVLRVTDASRFPLTSALAWALRLGDARLVYRAPDGRIFQLDLARDGRAGCISVGRGMLQGRPCLQELARFASARSGTIEIIQLSPQLVNVDLRSWPQSIIPGGVEEVRRAFGLAPAARPAAAPQPAAPPPRPAAAAAQPAAAPARPAAMPAARPAPPPPAAAPAVRLPAGYQLVEEFSHLAAAAIAIRGEELSAHVEGKTCTDAVIDALPAIPGRAYIVCRTERGSLHVLVEGKRVSAVYEPGDGGPLLAGAEALARASREGAREARVYIERG